MMSFERRSPTRLAGARQPRKVLWHLLPALLLAPGCTEQPPRPDFPLVDASGGTGAVNAPPSQDGGPPPAQTDATVSPPPGNQQPEAGAPPTMPEDGGLSAEDDGGSTPPDANPPSTGGACLDPIILELTSDLKDCRACHFTFGIARDSKFVLMSDPSGDAESLRAAYQSLGRELIAVPIQEDGRAHPGGSQITQSSPTYAAWEQLIDALANPATNCTTP
jgi:hypothetical protein